MKKLRHIAEIEKISAQLVIPGLGGDGSDVGGGGGAAATFGASCATGLGSAFVASAALAGAFSGGETPTSIEELKKFQLYKLTREKYLPQGHHPVLI